MSTPCIKSRWQSVGCLLAVGLGSCGGDATESPVPPERGGGLSITIFTDRSELFFEHPPLIAGAPGEAWAVHLTDLSDFGPVTTGRLTLEFVGPDGQVSTSVSDAPARDGVYDPAPSFPSAGMYDLVMFLEGSQVTDEIFVGPIRVFGSEDDLPQLPPAEAVGIAFLKEQQWPIDFATAEADLRVVPPGVDVSGEVVYSPGRVVEITAPVEGIVRWDLNRSAPPEGALVATDEPLVRLSPVGGTDTYAALRAEAARLEREVERSERLVAAEAVPARRLEEARHDLALVHAQLEVLDPSPDDSYTLTLRAPITGSVIRRNFVTGQRVEAGASLLTILDGRVLNVRFHVPASRSLALGDVTGATFGAEGGLNLFRTETVLSVGAAIDPVRRTVPVTLEVDNPDGVLKAGMLVSGRLLFDSPGAALAVPSEAIVDEDGLLIAYVQIGGETFERRAVTVDNTDGAWTTVLSGVRRGERVVTRGQYQIKLGSLNTSEISDHGHPH